MMTAETSTQTSLLIKNITAQDLENPLVSQAVEQAKIMYGEHITYILVNPTEEGGELAFRPDMAKFMPDTGVQIMRISDLSSMKDTLDCHNTIAIGNTRSQREPGAKSFYNVVIGQILAINPHKESLEKFSTQA